MHAGRLAAERGDASRMLWFAKAASWRRDQGASVSM